MSTLASERSWLLNPGLLKLVHQCRRLIHSEFGVKLHLTEEHLEQRLAEYASKTRSSHLIRTWEALAPQIPNLSLPEKDEKESDTPKRMYRGQAIAEPEAPKHEKADSSEAEPSPLKKKVIYRGQVVG